MLRISTRPRPGGTTLVVEGRLAGPWVDEVATSWRRLIAAEAPRAIHVDLNAVTFIDAPGKALLRTMHEQGGVLVCSACMTRAIVDEIAAAPRVGTPKSETEGIR